MGDELTMGDTPEATNRRQFLRTTGAILAGGTAAGLIAGSDQARADEKQATDQTIPDSEISRESDPQTIQYAEVPLGTNAAYNRINNWSAPAQHSGETQTLIPEVYGRWSTDSIIRDADVNPVEAVYGEDPNEPRKFMETRALSQGGAGYHTANAWSALEFYTTGTAAQAATIRMAAQYDIGMNWLDIKEIPGAGYVGNILDMMVIDRTANQELNRARIWEHTGTAENYTIHNESQQTSAVVWASNTVTVTLEPNRYYSAAFAQQSGASSVTPIGDVTDAMFPPKAYASQAVGIGYIEIGF